MLRGLIKSGIATGLHWSGTDRVIGACGGLQQVPLVLGYHRVVPDLRACSRAGIAPGRVTVATLERQLDWIGKRYRFNSVADMDTCISAGRRGGKPAAAVTFDDGYRDVYEHALPLLRKKGIPAAMFIVTGLVGTSRLQLHDELYLLLCGAVAAWRAPADRLVRLLTELDIHPVCVSRAGMVAGDPFRVMRVLLELLSRDELERIIAVLRREIEIPAGIRDELRSMTWEMLAQAARDGFVVGSHTRTHALLTNETPHRILAELRGSRDDLQLHLGIPARHLAYPDGRFNPTVLQAAHAAGYRSAFTTCMHRDPGYPLLTIPRRLLWENSCLDAFGRFSPALMSCQVHAVFEMLRGCGREHAA